MIEVTGAPQHRRHASRVFAAAVRAQRNDVSARMLQRSVRRSEINIGLELVALSFAERFADALHSADWPPLFAWIDDTCERYSATPVVRRLLGSGTAAIATLAGELRLGSAVSSAELRWVEEAVDGIVSRLRVSSALAPSDTLDEIDVALGELVGRLDATDPATAEHSRAVALWCARIGKRMALPAAQVIFVTRCGLIHDIGKMTTPPEILQAPRRLSVTEMNVMRRHAEDGSSIVGAIPLLAHHTPAVRWHHERLDGRGYPDGLGATAIPLAARIVAVADSFNAMIGNRPYRSPMRPTLALDELRRHAGTQFDPDVIAAMTDVLGKRA